MHVEPHISASADGRTIALAVSRYHAEVTDALCAGAIEVFTDSGGRLDDLLEARCPGAFDLPLICQALTRGDADAVVALGCVITGETDHDRYIANAVANGLTRVALDSGKPVAFGVLTCRTLQQARERAGGAKGNKGAEAMRAVLDSIGVLHALHAQSVGGND